MPGHARFYGADNDAAAGCDKEESTRISGPLIGRVKGRIETEWLRDYARVALRAALTLKAVKCWAVLRAPAGRRLATMLSVLVPLLRRDDELDNSDHHRSF